MAIAPLHRPADHTGTNKHPQVLKFALELDRTSLCHFRASALVQQLSFAPLISPIGPILRQRFQFWCESDTCTTSTKEPLVPSSGVRGDCPSRHTTEYSFTTPKTNPHNNANFLRPGQKSIFVPDATLRGKRKVLERPYQVPTVDCYYPKVLQSVPGRPADQYRHEQASTIEFFVGNYREFLGMFK